MSWYDWLLSTEQAVDYATWKEEDRAQWGGRRPWHTYISSVSALAFQLPTITPATLSALPCWSMLATISQTWTVVSTAKMATFETNSIFDYIVTISRLSMWLTQDYMVTDSTACSKMYLNGLASRRVMATKNYHDFRTCMYMQVNRTTWHIVHVLNANSLRGVWPLPKNAASG